MNALDPSTIVPIRMDVPRPRSWRDSLGALAAESVVSLLANVAVIAGLIHIAFPRDLPSPEQQAISVDIVSEPAAPNGARGAKGRASPGGTASGPRHTEASPTVATSEGAERKPDSPEAKRSEPPSTTESAAPERPSPAAQPAVDQAAQTTARPPAPPPLDLGRDPAPKLVEAPADPRRAATQSDQNEAANAELKPAETATPVEVPPPPSPDVVATGNTGAEPVPKPGSTAMAKAPATAVTAESLRQAENTAKLAAALPFSQSYVPAANRAALSGTGQSETQNFRGEVYGNFRKADDLVEAARAKHLRGQAVVLFSINDEGGLVSAKIAVSSGDPAVDETALDIIRRSAPFPPPPPGAPRVFSPAIGFGQDGP